MTVTRLTPMEFFCAVAAPLVENRCYPVLQVEVNNPDPTWPTIVYSGLSPETDTTLASGPFTTGLSLRYECRSDDWQETIELSAKCPSSNKWDRCAVRLSECFAHHFHVMRRVVDSANDVPRWSFV